MLFQYCCCSASVLLQYYFSAVPILFQYCSSIALVLLQHCVSTVPILFQYCSSTVSVLFQYCWKCSNTVAVLFQWLWHWFSQENVDSERWRLLLEWSFALVFLGKCWFWQAAPPLGIDFCIGFIKELLIERGGAHTWNWLLHWFCQENVDSKRRCCLLELTFVPRPFLRISLPKLEVTRNITCKLSQRSSNLTKKHQATD